MKDKGIKNDEIPNSNETKKLFKEKEKIRLKKLTSKLERVKKVIQKDLVKQFKDGKKIAQFAWEDWQWVYGFESELTKNSLKQYYDVDRFLQEKFKDLSELFKKRGYLVEGPEVQKSYRTESWESDWSGSHESTVVDKVFWDKPIIFEAKVRERNED